MSRGRSAAAARLAEAAPVFAALGDATRLRLVARLCGGGPLSIARLSEGAGVTRQAIAKHLSVLADAGLVESVRAGRELRYRARGARLSSLADALDAIGRRWDHRLEALKRIAERPD